VPEVFRQIAEMSIPESGRTLKGTPRHLSVLGRMSDLLGLDKPIRAERELASIVSARLPAEVIDVLAREGLTAKELAIVAPPRTLSHRRARSERLSLDESDRVVRLARIAALAEIVFGERDRALRWLRKGLRRFNGVAPFAMLATEAGGRLVEEALIQIDEGYSA
jgi:putative toxin-antitoxin system antitoxin component (TIGR02293 family)